MFDMLDKKYFYYTLIGIFSSTIRNFPPAKSFPLPESLPPELPLQKNEYKERLKAAFELVSPRKGKTGANKHFVITWFSLSFFLASSYFA